MNLRPELLPVDPQRIAEISRKIERISGLP
jgi:hypothetical protein